MHCNWKKTAVLALLAAVCAVPAYAEDRPKLADGELFVNERIVKDGRVVYKALDTHDNWEHDAEKQVPGLVVTAFIPPKDGKPGPELASVKKLTTKQEKILEARRHYTGADYANKLVLFAAMNTNGQNGKLDITKAELFGRLLNVTVAIQDPTGAQDDGSEAISEEHVVTIPLSKLPQFGNLRVRFSDTTGHALDDMDVAMER